MGVFSTSCIISGLPIGEGDNTPVRFFVLMQNPFEGESLGVHAHWVPLHTGIRGVYNDYGSIKQLDDTLNTTSFFETLSKFAIELEVGKNPYHDVSVQKGMSSELWLEALWENRVLVQEPVLTDNVTGSLSCVPKDGSKLKVAWAMIREDVWGVLVSLYDNEIGQCNPRSLDPIFPMAGWSPDVKLREEHSKACSSMHYLSKIWLPGHISGPQWAEWEIHKLFLNKLQSIVSEQVSLVE